MKLKTSFSELTTFKKNITRFLPLWLVYLVGCMVVMMDSSHGTYDRFAKSVLTSMIPSFGVVNILYAGICGVLLFGDLYNTRMCYSLHTVPLRRESLFASHWCAALMFSLVPNFLVSLFLMTQLEAYWFLALYWLLASTLQFIFFFGIAAVSAMLTGNRFAMLLVYAGFNFISVLAYWVISSIYLPMMEGVYVNQGPFYLLCPVIYLFSGYSYFDFKAESIIEKPSDSYFGSETTFYRYEGLGTGWGYLAVLGVLGLVFAAIAIWLYRKRHLESAGDFIAFPKLKLPACVIITVCATSVFALLPEWVFGGESTVWAIVGFVLGFFGSLMLLERRIKVFRLKTLIGFVLMGALLVGSLFAVEYDIFNVVHWTPKADRVESLTVTTVRPSDVMIVDARGMDPGYYGNGIQSTLTDPEDIQAIIEAHEYILSRLNANNGGNNGYYDMTRITFIYQMKDGRSVLRSYTIVKYGPAWDTVRKYLYTAPNIMGYTDWESYVSNVTSINISGNDVPKLHYRALLEALRKDCLDGHVGPEVSDYYGYVDPEVSDYYGYVDIRFKTGDGITGHRSLSISIKAANTLDLLRSPEFLMGYQDWDTFLAGKHTLMFDGNILPEQFRISLLEALRKDCEAGAVGIGYMKDGIYHIMGLEFRTAEGDGFLELGLTKNAVNVLALIEEYESGDWKK